jgi:CDP-6-deoxy-D-xylo-4-hexulose-3-dehydrase
MKRLDWPLMQQNVTTEDKLALLAFLTPEQLPRLTNGPQVEAFEAEFSAWLGVKYAVMVNSGASANLITLQALKIMHGAGRVLVPAITWVSDIAAVLHAGMEPVFVDVDPQTFGMDWKQARVAEGVQAIFPTHCLGFNAMIGPLPACPVIEDACEAIGAVDQHGWKVGTRGLMSNFSFYYGHHMTTIEGGMVCTDHEHAYEILRMLRSHGLVREMKNEHFRSVAEEERPDLDPEFIFTHPAYNVRSTELNAVIGRSQLKRLDANNAKRTQNLLLFLALLDPKRYRTVYAVAGSSNFALPLVLHEPDAALFQKILWFLRNSSVEFRQGTAGGGNQLRQPYARDRWGDLYKQFPQAEHIHQFGLYVGNYPDLEAWKIEELSRGLNAL